MAAKRFNETDIDFEAIDGELAKLVPPKLSLKDVLDRLRGRMVEQQAKGVTVAQMHEVLKAQGIQIGERSLKVFLEKGERRDARRRRPWRRRREAKREATRSEGHGAECRGREGDIARRARSRRRYTVGWIEGEKAGNGDGA